MELPLAFLLAYMMLVLVTLLLFLISATIYGGFFMLIQSLSALQAWLKSTTPPAGATSNVPASCPCTEAEGSSEDLSLYGKELPESWGFVDFSRTPRTILPQQTISYGLGTGPATLRNPGLLKGLYIGGRNYSGK